MPSSQLNHASEKLNIHLLPDIKAHEQGYQIWQIWYFGLTLASPLNPNGHSLISNSPE